jgi:hypothetical protein
MTPVNSFATMTVKTKLKAFTGMVVVGVVSMSLRSLAEGVGGVLWVSRLDFLLQKSRGGNASRSDSESHKVPAGHRTVIVGRFACISCNNLDIGRYISR